MDRFFFSRLSVKRRESDGQGERGDGEQRCAAKSQKRAPRLLAFATEQHVQEEATGLGEDADDQQHAEKQLGAITVSRLC